MDIKNLKDFRRGTVTNPPHKVIHDPYHDEDEFEEVNNTEEAHHDSAEKKADRMHSGNLLEYLKIEGDEDTFGKMLAKVFPPNPLLPKTF